MVAKYDPQIKTLVIDIEVSPYIVHVWSMWDQNITPDRLIKDSEMMCFAAKWTHQKEIQFYSQFHHGRDSMVEYAHEMLDAADVVVGYNSKKFDVPRLQHEFGRHELLLPSPFKQVDLLPIARKNFHYAFNRLGYVTDQNGIGVKMKHQGHPLWIACMDEDPKAWEKMKRYNMHDVRITAKLYEKWRPLAPSVPSYASLSGKVVCPGCGSPKVQARGFSYTATGRFQRYNCTICGKWSRATQRSNNAAKLTGIA